jgi:hypothetical protein
LTPPPPLRPGDIVLVKGSVRNSDFRQVVSLLKTRLAAPPALRKGHIARLLINLSTGEQRVAERADSPFTSHYLSQLLLACYIADRLLNKNHAADCHQRAGDRGRDPER